MKYPDPVIHSIECPRCFAPPGVRCVYTEKHSQSIRYTWTHSLRRRDYKKMKRWVRMHGNILTGREAN